MCIVGKFDETKCTLEVVEPKIWIANWIHFSPISALHLLYLIWDANIANGKIVFSIMSLYPSNNVSFNTKNTSQTTLHYSLRNHINAYTLNKYEIRTNPFAVKTILINIQILHPETIQTDNWDKINELVWLD